MRPCLGLLFLLCLEPLDLKQRVELGKRLAVRAAPPVGEGEVLSVVDSEVQMVQGVVCWAVDDRLQRVTGDHVRVVDLDATAAVSTLFQPW